MTDYHTRLARGRSGACVYSVITQMSLWLERSNLPNASQVSNLYRVLPNLKCFRISRTTKLQGDSWQLGKVRLTLHITWNNLKPDFDLFNLVTPWGSGSLGAHWQFLGVGLPRASWASKWPILKQNPSTFSWDMTQKGSIVTHLLPRLSQSISDLKLSHVICRVNLTLPSSMVPQNRGLGVNEF